MIRAPRWPGESGGNYGNGDASAAITPFTVAAVLLQRWRLVVGVPLLTVMAAVVAAIVFRDYTAQSRFVPQAARGELSRFAGLAAQIGLPIGMEATAESPDFYVDLVLSGEVLRPAVQGEYAFAMRPGSADSMRGAWLDLAGIEGDSPEERLRNGIDAMRDKVRASASIKSGIVTVRTTAPWPGLAEALNARILVLLSQFDRDRRQAGARAERVFVEERMAGAKRDLESAESALARYLERNKRPESPRLVMGLEQLQRQVGLRQEVYGALAQAYEQASIEEVRNTPVITVVDRPDGTARGSRGIVMVALLAFLLGLIAAIGMAFVLDWYDRRADSPEMHALRASLRAQPRRVTAGDAGG